MTLRNAKILKIIQITSLLNKKSSKISSKTTVSADKISSLVLFTIKSNLKCVTPASLDAGKPPVQKQLKAWFSDDPLYSEVVQSEAQRDDWTEFPSETHTGLAESI